MKMLFLILVLFLLLLLSGCQPRVKVKANTDENGDLRGGVEVEL